MILKNQKYTAQSFNFRHNDYTIFFSFYMIRGRRQLLNHKNTLVGLNIFIHGSSTCCCMLSGLNGGPSIPTYDSSSTSCTLYPCFRSVPNQESNIMLRHQTFKEAALIKIQQALDIPHVTMKNTKFSRQICDDHNMEAASSGNKLEHKCDEVLNC